MSNIRMLFRENSIKILCYFPNQFVNIAPNAGCILFMTADF